MKVKELIELLRAVPNQEAIVILQKDAEGNGYSPLAGIDGENNGYIAESTYHGEVRLIQLNEALEAEGYSEEDTVEDSAYEECVGMWPIN